MDDAELDERQQQVLDLLVLGVAKVQIARAIGVHRNVIGLWCKRPEFLRELQRRLDERDAMARLRRSHETSRYADRLYKLADSALREAELRPLDRGKQLVVKRWLRLYRALLAMERQEMERQAV